MERNIEGRVEVTVRRGRMYKMLKKKERILELKEKALDRTL